MHEPCRTVPIDWGNTSRVPEGVVEFAPPPATAEGSFCSQTSLSRTRGFTGRVGLSSKHRVGIVGLGARAEKVLPEALRDVDLALRAVCDVDPGRYNSWDGVPAFSDYEEMLEKVDLDFIIVMTPHDSHLPVVRAAARHGVHVLKEKPFARSLDEALELRAICDGAGIHLMTVLPRRFNRNYVLFHEWRDRVGQPFFVDLRYTKFVEHPGTGWRGKRSLAGGGCLVDMGYHMVDLLLWNLAVPDTIHASMSAAAAPNVDYDAEDTALVAFTHPGGLHGSLTVSRFMPDDERVRLVGSEGILEATPEGVRFLGSDGELVESRALCGERSPTAQQLDYFSGVIRGEQPNFASPTEHLVHARFVEACYASHDQRGTRQ